MRYDRSTFKRIDRNREKTVVLIPGWATDYRIFGSLDIEFNYLLPVNFSPFRFGEELVSALREHGIARVSLFGWSLGGFVAQEFALSYPEYVDSLTFISMRRRYRADELENIRLYLKRNKNAYLYKFYTQCFHDRDRLRFFRENLMKYYLKELDLDYLLETLDYFLSSEMKPEPLSGFERVTLMHGECDRIAPLEEAKAIRNTLPKARLVIVKEAGHIPFLKENLRAIDS